MAIDTENTYEFTIAAIIEQALKLVGMMALEEIAQGEQWNARARFGRRQLEIILKTLQGKHKTVLRQQEFYTVTLSLSTDGAEASPIELPGDTIDVFGNGMLKRTGEIVESLVRQIDRETWHQTATKDTAGPPTRMYVDRSGATVKLYLLPLPPSADYGTIRISRQKLAANSIDGQNTPDAERYWVDYLQWELAARFATGPLPRQAREAEARAGEALKAALSGAKSQVAPRAVYRHRTGWHNR